MLFLPGHGTKYNFFVLYIDFIFQNLVTGILIYSMVLNKDSSEFMPFGGNLSERIWWAMLMVGVVLHNF